MSSSSPVLRSPPDAVSLFKPLMLLSLPVLAEQALHMVVGLNDTYLANHLPQDSTPAAAAVGSVADFLWFFGLIAGSLGIGATALISRAVGARHRRLANSVCGQTMSAAVVIGLLVGVTIYLLAAPIATLSGLQGVARPMAETYLRLLSLALPFSTVMFVGGACLRGAGDTLTPAITMILVDVINVIATFSLCRGWGPIPVLGFEGIAIGTVMAYVAGGLLMIAMLFRGRGGIRLYLHRMKPQWHTLRRVLQIGLPSCAESVLAWGANMGVVIVVNRMAAKEVMAAAHINTIRIENISFLGGIAFSTAAATMVGQNLGRKRPDLAARSAWLAYTAGGGMMTLCGLFFIFFGKYPADWISGTPEVAELTRLCLFITGFIQCGFAMAAIFGGALRGAGDTMAVMKLSLTSVLGVRLVGVLIVVYWFHLGLGAIWIVLAGELMLRGLLIFGRFLFGSWKQIQV
jgi:putative MATE family efflux protein